MKEKNEAAEDKEIEKKGKDYVTVVGGVTTINLKHPDFDILVEVVKGFLLA